MLDIQSPARPPLFFYSRVRHCVYGTLGMHVLAAFYFFFFRVTGFDCRLYSFALKRE